MPEDAVPARGGDRELGPGPGIGLEERVLVADHVAGDLDRPGDEGTGWIRPHLGATAVRLLPQRPPARVGGEELEAPERRPARRVLPERDRDDPGRAPELAVGDHIEPRALLERDGLADRPVLGRPKGLGRHPALAGALPRQAQGLRAEQAAHHVGSGCHRRSLGGPIMPYGVLTLVGAAVVPCGHPGGVAVPPPPPPLPLVDGRGDCPLTAPKGFVRHERVR